MISYVQAIILGALQGVTELFPISSLGHSVIVPALLSWNIDQNADFFVVFLVATHLATALVLIGFFWKDWVKIFQGFVRSIVFRKIKGDAYAKLAWLIIVSTIPAGLLGLVFEKKFAALFGAPKSAALFLIANGILLFVAEKMRRRRYSSLQKIFSADEKISKMSWTEIFRHRLRSDFGSYSGIFSHRRGAFGRTFLRPRPRKRRALRFSSRHANHFRRGAVLKLPSLFHGGYPRGATLVGALFAALGAYLSVKFLTKYFKTKTLTPFAWYSVIAGVVSFTILFVR